MKLYKVSLHKNCRINHLRCPYAHIRWPKNAILCVVLRIMLDINRKRLKLRVVSAIAELLVYLCKIKSLKTRKVSNLHLYSLLTC